MLETVIEHQLTDKSSVQEADELGELMPAPASKEFWPDQLVTHTSW